MRTATWENIGNEITISTRLPLELCFDVEKQPLKFGEENLPLEGWSTIVNGITGRAYGPVSDKYTPITNRDAFDFIETIDGLEMKKWGETKNGTQWIIGALPEVKVLGDSFIPYLVGRNSFDGSCPLQMTVAPLRIVCQNQINIAFHESNNTVRILHSKTYEEKLKMGQILLQKEIEYMSQLNKTAEKYANIKITPLMIDNIIKDLFPEPSPAVSNTIRERWEEKVNTFRAAYSTDDNRNFRGTAWGVINAYSDYVTHFDGSRKTDTANENRFLSVTFDPRIMQKMMEILAARSRA